MSEWEYIWVAITLLGFPVALACTYYLQMDWEKASFILVASPFWPFFLCALVVVGAIFCVFFPLECAHEKLLEAGKNRRSRDLQADEVES